jgi:hypothetical protein
MVLAQKYTSRPVEQNTGPDMNPHSYAQLIFDKGEYRWRKDSLFAKYCWEKLLSACRKLILDLSTSVALY